MGIMKDLAKSGMFGLAGLAATNKDITNKIARNGGFGLAGMLLAKKKKQMQPQVSGGPVPTGMRVRPMVDEVMVAEEAPAGASTMRKGGKVKKKPMATKKMAKGGSASRRADGCATKGKTKGRFV
jgi:hypothetical protein